MKSAGMMSPTDTGALVLDYLGLGCFVSDRRFDAPRRERPVVYDSLRYVKQMWNAREAEFRLNQLVDYVVEMQGGGRGCTPTR